MQKIFLLILIIISSHLFSNAQNEANNWYFGNFAGIDFNSGTATAVTNGAMQQYEGSATISNKYGELLFYTDGQRVWNKKHQQMPNGYGLIGNPSTTQVIIFPLPESENIYYIISADNNAKPGGLNYTIVDITLDNGKGDIISKNNLIFTPSSEKMAAVRHANGTDIWLVTHPLSTNKFYTYLITSAGIQLNNPVISAVGSYISTSSGVPRGYLKISPTGQKLAAAIEGLNKYELFDFDRATGNIANCITLDNNYYNSAYGIEFSPDEHYLYGSERWGNHLWRFDLTADDIPASVEQIATLSSNHGGALQLGVDNKIYLSRYNGYLGVIENPEDENPNFTDNAFFLKNKSSVEGLPGYLSSFFGKLNITVENTCFNDETVFTIHTNDEISTVKWNFNFPSADALYQSTDLNPTFIYPTAGNYTIELITQFTNGSIDTLYEDIRIYQLPQPDLSAYIEVCDNTEINAGANFETYLWNTGETSQIITVDETGSYNVTVTNNHGCFNSDTIDITVNYSPEITYTSQNATTIGINDGSIDVTVTGGTPDYSYLWNTGETTEDLNNIPAGCYEITVTDQNSCTDTENICINGPIECNKQEGFQWAKRAGDIYNDEGYGITCDTEGNTYITGYFQGTADFGTHSLTSVGGIDIFIAKYNPLGECLWAKRAGGTNFEKGYGITSDSNGNTYITGYFRGTADFGTHSLTSDGGEDVFIAKYNPLGECLWAKRAGGTSSDEGYGITSDTDGNSYITGRFFGTVDFGTHSLTSDGEKDVFIAKYNPLGECLWAKRAGSISSDEGSGITSDTDGNSYITGYFFGTADFGTHSLVAVGRNDIFIAKYNPLGECLWAKRAGAPNYNYDFGKGITSDSNGNTFITGSFQGIADFGTYSLTSAGGSEIFIAKYNPLGECLWAKRAGSTSSERGYGITSDNDGNTYITGNFQGTADFGTHSLTSAGGNEIFIAKYNALGECLWAKRAGGTSSDRGYGITSDNDGNTYITGFFYQGLADFGTHSLTSEGEGDIFIAKYNDNFFNLKNIEFSGNACDYTNSCIDIEIEDGVAPFNYQWSTGETTEDICGITTGEYGVTIVDANDCYVDTTIIVTVPDTLSLSATVINLSQAGASDGSINLSVIGGTSPYQYNWSNGASTEDLENLPAGTYSVIVTDAYDCTSTTTVVIIEPDNPIELQLVGTLNCSSGDNGTINLTISGGSAPYNILWSNGETSEDISGLSSAWYSVTVDDGTYVAIDSIFLSSENLISTQIEATNTCQGTNNGNINLSISGGTAPYDYLWSNGETSQNITMLSASTYSVIVTDNLNCTAKDTIEVFEDALPNIAGTINGESDFCLPSSVYSNIYNTALIQNASSYTWTLTPPEAGTISGNGTQGFINWTLGYSGQASIQVAGTNHCGSGTASDIFEVDVYNLPTSNINGTATICENETTNISLNLTGTAPWNITYTDGTNSQNITTSDNPYIFSVSEAGTYEVTALADAHCTGTEFGNQAVVTINELPTSNINGTATICENETTNISLNLTGTAPWNITYTDGTNSNSITTSDNPYIFSVSEAGTYEVTALTDAHCTGTELGSQAVVTVNELPTSNINGTATICENETTNISLNLTGTAPWNVSYTDGTNSQNITTSNNPYIFSVSEAGTYEVTALTDAHCTGTELGSQAVVTVNELPVFSLGEDTVVCEGDSLILKIANVFDTYLWSDNSQEAELIIFEGGKYWLRAGNNTCFGSDTIFVNKVTVPDFNLPNDTIICEGNSFTVSVPDIYDTYEWNTNDILNEIEITEAGEYTLKAFKGICFKTDTLNVSLKNCSEIIEINIPNGFTPNGDSYNDTWIIDGIEEISKIVIFNRWGDIVFKSENYNNNWDGGKSPSGAYFYTIWLKSGRIINGTINLLR